MAKPTFAILVLKKRFISSLFLCAFAILFAHSITPHHHHEELKGTHQGNHPDNESGDLDNNVFEDVSLNFQHDSSIGLIYRTTSPTFQVAKSTIDKDIILLTQYYTRQLFKPPIIHREIHSFAFTPSRYSAVRLFRGPPMA